MAAQRGLLLLIILLAVPFMIISAKKVKPLTTPSPPIYPEDLTLPDNCVWSKGDKLKTHVECDVDVPDFSSYDPTTLTAINGLSVSGCQFVVLPYGNLQNLANLTQLSVDCSESVVQDGALNGLNNLTFLSIGRSVGVLPKDLVCHMTNLNTLRLDNNFIASDADFGLLTNCSAHLEPVLCGGNVTTLSASVNLLTSIVKDGFLCNLRGLTELNLTGNAISVIENDAFSAVPNLRRLYLGRNALSTLPVDVFQSTINLTYLDLSFNRLSVLPNGLLKSLTKLHFLNLRGNAIATLNPALFTGLALLGELDLADNQMTDVTWIFQPLTSLSKVNLSGNQLTQINSAAFPSLTSLNHLLLDSNNISFVADDAFVGSPRLSILSMRYNRLKSVPNFSYNRFVVALFLDHNEIENVQASDFTFLSLLLSLHLNNNRLTSLGPDVFSPVLHLLKLDLSNNNLKSLDNSSFSGLFALKFLSLDGNELSLNDNCYEDPISGAQQMDVFAPLKSLLFLNISDNEITQFEYSWFPFSLIYLNLAYNEIKQLPTWTLKSIPFLHTLDLSYNLLENLADSQFPPSVTHLILNSNKIHHIEEDTFQDLKQLESVNLRENALRTLAELKMGSPITTLFLRDNPWLCDCKMEWLKNFKALPVYDALLMKCEFLANLSSVIGEPEEEPTSFLAANPVNFLCAFKKDAVSSVYGQSFMKLGFVGGGGEKTVTKCFGPTCAQQQKCPENCVCYHNLFWTFVKVVCLNPAGLTEVPDTLPDATDSVLIENQPIVSINVSTFKSYSGLKEVAIRKTKLFNIGGGTFTYSKTIERIYLDNNQLKTLPANVFGGLEKVKTIDLSFNRLRAIPPDTFDGLNALQTLNLQNNMLTSFPVWSFKELPTLSEVGLNGNPWTCNCTFMFPAYDYVKANSAKLKNITDLYCKPSPEVAAASKIPENSTIPIAIFNMTQCFQTRLMAEFNGDNVEGEAVTGSNAAAIVVGVMATALTLMLVVIAVVYRRELRYQFDRMTYTGERLL